MALEDGAGIATTAVHPSSSPRALLSQRVAAVVSRADSIEGRPPAQLVRRVIIFGRERASVAGTRSGSVNQGFIGRPMAQC